MVHEVRNQGADTVEARDRELKLRQRHRPQQGPDTFGPWPIRRRRIGINAACPRDRCASCRRRSCELFGKSALSDTRLAANPDNTRRAALAVGERAGKDGELEVSAQDLRRREGEQSVFGVPSLRPKQQSAPRSYVVLGPRFVCRMAMLGLFENRIVMF